ncbi:MAG: hypothetical protein KIS63_05735 [Caldilineales bacterium]|nr:hypothetical protein [Caldilineales bacterium]
MGACVAVGGVESASVLVGVMASAAPIIGVVVIAAATAEGVLVLATTVGSSVRSRKATMTISRSRTSPKAPPSPPNRITRPDRLPAAPTTAAPRNFVDAEGAGVGVGVRGALIPPPPVTSRVGSPPRG